MPDFALGCVLAHSTTQPQPVPFARVNDKDFSYPRGKDISHRHGKDISHPCGKQISHPPSE